jgi:hypothetical protein
MFGGNWLIVQGLRGELLRTILMHRNFLQLLNLEQRAAGTSVPRRRAVAGWRLGGSS